MAGPPTEPLTALKNLGPESARMLRAVGIETPEALRDVGAALAYRMVGHRFPGRASVLLLWALEGALTGRHWNSFSPEEKARLRAEADGDLDVGPG